MLRSGLKSILQNRFVRCGYEIFLSLVDVGFQHSLSLRGIYISSGRLDINEWFDSGLIAGDTIDPTNKSY